MAGSLENSAGEGAERGVEFSRKTGGLKNFEIVIVEERTGGPAMKVLWRGGKAVTI